MLILKADEPSFESSHHEPVSLFDGHQPSCLWLENGAGTKDGVSEEDDVVKAEYVLLHKVIVVSLTVKIQLLRYHQLS